MWYAIPLAAMAVAYWVGRELILDTFKNASKRIPYIIGFAVVGFSLAVIFVVAGHFMHPDLGMLIPRYGPLQVLQLILCPSALLGLALMDVPHPSLSSTVVLGLLIAVMNSALYAVFKSRAVRS